MSRTRASLRLPVTAPLSHDESMVKALTGVVHGNTIALDEAVPPLDGQRVSVTLEPLTEADIELSPEEQIKLLREWAARGPQGPIEGPEEWPDESR